MTLEIIELEQQAIVNIIHGWGQSRVECVHTKLVTVVPAAFIWVIEMLSWQKCQQV